MEKFGGFPARMQFTPLPNLFWSSLLPQINDIVELKVTLHLFRALYGKRGYPRFTTRRELLGEASLLSSLREGDKTPDELLGDALALAVRRGTILHLVLEKDGAPEDIYLLNTESDRQAAAKIHSGQIDLPGWKAKAPVTVADTEPPPDIFVLYEQNIGMLTPLVADELRAAEGLYPAGWMRDAIKEAVSLNKRSWRYIARILERWAAEGKDSGTHQRDSKKTDPDKYVKGKYGHVVRH